MKNQYLECYRFEPTTRGIQGEGRHSPVVCSSRENESIWESVATGVTTITTGIPLSPNAFWVIYLKDKQLRIGAIWVHTRTTIYTRF